MKTVFGLLHVVSRYSLIFMLIGFPLLVSSEQPDLISGQSKQQQKTQLNSLKKIPQVNFDNLEELLIQQINKHTSQLESKQSDYYEAKKELITQYAQMGQFFHAHELFEPAEICYQNVLILEPSNFTSAYLLSLIYKQQAQFKQAIISFISAAQIKSDYLPLWINLADSMLELGEFEQSFKAYKNAEFLAPDDASVYAGLANLMLKKKSFQQAIEYFIKALDIQPSADRLYYQLAMAYRGLGDNKKAREYLKRSGKVGVIPYDPLFENLKQLHTGERVQLLEGKKSYKLGDYSRAAHLFKSALDAAPQSVRARINLAASLSKLKKYSEAESYLKQAVQLQPDNVTAHYNLGQLYYFRKTYKEAIKHLVLAAELSPEDAEILLLLAKTQKILGKIKDSLHNYKKLTQLSPMQASVWTGYAQLLLQDKQFEAAVSTLIKGNQQLPDNLNISHDLARVLVTIPQAFRDGKKALPLAIKVMNSQPSILHADTLIRAQLETGNCTAAEKLINQVIDSIDEREPRLNTLKANYQNLLKKNLTSCENYK